MATSSSSGFRFPAGSTLASSGGSVVSDAVDNINANSGDRPSTPSSPSKSQHRDSNRTGSVSPSKYHRTSFSNAPSTPSHHQHSTSTSNISTPKHTPNPHPYAIKTTSTALLSRSSSRSSSHYDSYHHYVPPSPSKSPGVTRGRGYGYGGASESESEDGGNQGLGVGTGRHRYSRSLTGDDVPSLPRVPPREGGDKAGGHGVVYSEPEGLDRGSGVGGQGAKEDRNGDDDDDTPRKNARVRPSAKDLFATPAGKTKEGRGHRHSHSHASYLVGGPGASVERQHTGELQRQHSGGQPLIPSDLPTDPKSWSVSQLSTYLVSALASNSSSSVPAPIASDIAKIVRNKRITGKAFLRLTEGDLKGWGINQLWRSTLIGAKESLRRGMLRGKMGVEVGGGRGAEQEDGDGYMEGGEEGEDEGSTDNPLPSSANTSSGLDRTWSFSKGSRRIKSVRLNDLTHDDGDDQDDDHDNNDVTGSPTSSRGSHSRSSSVASSASGRVRDMIDSLERSASGSSGSGLEEEGSISETGVGGESRLEGWKRGAGMSPTKREFASNGYSPAKAATGTSQKPLPVRGSVNHLFGPPSGPATGPTPVIAPFHHQHNRGEDDDDMDAVATIKKKKDDDATVTNKARAPLNGREPRLLPFPPTGSGGHHHHHHRTITPSHTGVAHPLPPSPHRDLHDSHTGNAPIPLDAYEFGVKTGWKHFGYSAQNPSDYAGVGYGLQQEQPLAQHAHGQYQHPNPQQHLQHHHQHQHPQQHQHQHQQHLHPQQHQQQQQQHRIASPQTQLYVVRHNPSPGVTSPEMGGRMSGSPGSGNGRGSAGKRLLPYPPVVREAELHHPRPKRVIGAWDGDEGAEGGGEEDGERSASKGDDDQSDAKTGVESGVEGYVTALETATSSSSSTSTSTSSSSSVSDKSTLVESQPPIVIGGYNETGDKTITVHIDGEGGDEPSIEELLERGEEMLSMKRQQGEGHGKSVSGVEAWEMELGETVKRISASVKAGKMGGGGSVRGPRLSGTAGGMGMGMGNVGIGVHGDRTMSVGDLPSASLGRTAGTVGTKRGGVLDLFNIPSEGKDEKEKEKQSVVEPETQHALQDRNSSLTQREQELSERDVSLSRKDYSLIEREVSITEREGELDHRDHALVDREHDLDARERVLDVFKDALDRRAEGMDRRAVMLAEREVEVAEREGEVGEREREREYVLGVREDEVRERGGEVRVREGELDERENKLDERERELGEREGVGRVWEGEMGERENKLEEREKRLDEMEKRLEERERVVEGREERLEDREMALLAAKDVLSEEEGRVHGREMALEKREENVVDNERKIKNRLREVQRKEKEVEEREVESMRKEEERKARARASADVNVKELANVGAGLENRERELEKKERGLEERERSVIIKLKEATLEALEKELKVKEKDVDNPFWPLPISLLRKGWGTLVMPLVGEDKTPEFLLPYQSPPARPSGSGVVNDDEAEPDRPSSPLEGNESVVSAGSTSTVTPTRNLKRRGGAGDATSSSTAVAASSPSSTQPTTSSNADPSTPAVGDKKLISPWVIKRDFLLGQLGFGYFTNSPGEGGMLGGRLNGGYWVLMSIGVCVVVLKALSLGGVRGIGGLLRGGGGRR